jgi:hypothetical protein
MSNLGKTRLKGHALSGEGVVAYDQHGMWVHYPVGPTPLHAVCECGALSPAGITKSAAKRWHREHKDSLR